MGDLKTHVISIHILSVNLCREMAATLTLLSSDFGSSSLQIIRGILTHQAQRKQNSTVTQQSGGE